MDFVLNKIVPEIIHLSIFQHENVIKFYEHFATENYLYLVTEYCDVFLFIYI
jgi:serine/threonine protein kinase